MEKFLSIICILIGLAILGGLSLKEMYLKQNCTGYLKCASDASTTELALRELDKAIEYLERNELTEGYTSILWKTQDENVGFWYQNLKECQNELRKVDSKTSQLEKTNLLMKLRETLTDNDENGTSLTVPKGLSRHPHNIIWGLIQSIGYVLIYIPSVILFLAVFFGH